MRLTDLLESSMIWYHGTPDGQDFNGSFDNRRTSTSYISNPKLWHKLQNDLTHVDSGSDEYMKLLDQIANLKEYKSFRSPIFFSNKHGTAQTYADDKRSFNYQEADPRVIHATIKEAPTLTVDAHGKQFRGIDVNSVISGLTDSGISSEQAKEAMDHFADSIRGAGGTISTDRLALISQIFHFDIVDVVNVKDNYMGGGAIGTVRMVFDPSLIRIMD